MIACDAAAYAAEAVTRIMAEEMPEDAAELRKRSAELREMLIDYDIVTGETKDA